jgi:hypothetical protein
MLGSILVWKKTRILLVVLLDFLLFLELQKCRPIVLLSTILRYHATFDYLLHNCLRNQFTHFQQQQQQQKQRNKSNLSSSINLV